LSVVEGFEGSPVFAYLNGARRLSLNTLLSYGIDSCRHEIVFPYFRDNELLLTKTLKLERPNGKKQIRLSEDAELCLFGWQAVKTSSRALVITEGEIDAMSLHQYDLGYAVVSVPNGATAITWVENEFDNLSIYDEIYICFDGDEAGKAGAKLLEERLKMRELKFVSLPFKDINDCLVNGVTKETIIDCFKKAKASNPHNLVNVSDGAYTDDIFELHHPVDGKDKGYELPWARMEGTVLLRTPLVATWTGHNGHGKTQLLNNVVLGCLKQGARVCVASLEMPAHNLLYGMSRQASAKKTISRGYIEAINKWYDHRLWIYDRLGAETVDKLMEAFLYARQKYDADFFVIDSMMMCGIAEEEWGDQTEFLSRLCAFSKEYNCQIHLVAHAKKLKDEKEIPSRLDIKGSSNISNMVDYNFIVFRCTDAQDKIAEVRRDGFGGYTKFREEGDCRLICDKARNIKDKKGEIRLWFDEDSIRYVDNYGDKPIPYVEFEEEEIF